MMTNVLIIDDDLGEFATGLKHALKEYRLHFAYSGRDALEMLAKNPDIGLVLLDIKMPPDFAETESREGLEVLKHLKQARPDLPVIMLTVLRDVDLVVEAMRAGAFHYITKPIDRDKLREAVKHAAENAELKRRITTLTRAHDAVLTVHTGAPATARPQFHGMVGAHPLMQQLYHQIERAAPFEDVNIVILGATGSGKDLVARAIHECSPRRAKSYIAVNCAALSESMLEAELFGHEKGAFTGADARRDGLFVRADGGTLFLDEIGEMSPALQSKLLRAIENKEITPIGGAPVQVDVRIVCATHRDLAELRKTGKFREDLYYRICDVPLTLPPLQARREDIPLLIRHFLDEYAAKNHLDCSVEPAAVAALAAHHWPGNVRELAAAIRRLMVFAENGRITESQVRECLGLRDEAVVPGEARGITGEEAQEPRVPEEREPPPDWPFEEYPEIADLTEFRRIHGEIKLKQVLERAIKEGGNARAAMVLLGVPEDRYDGFRKWLQRLDIKVRELT
jgi:DNA-binding NtrC family response regulator